MKSESTRRNLLAIAASSLVAISSTHAADITWDIAPGTVGAGNGTVTGGAGIWSTDPANGNWTTDAGANNIAWDNTANANDTAIFGGTAGAITLGTNITAGGLTFNTTGYTITGSTLTLAGATAPILNVSTGTSTISSDLAGTKGLEKTGGGTLILSGTNNTYSGTTTITAGTLQGNKTISGASPFGTSTIQLNAGTLSSVTSSATDTAETFTFGNSINVGGNATINFTRVGGVGSGKTHAYGNLSIGSNTLSFTANNIGHTLSFTGAILTGNAIINNGSDATLNIGAITETGGARNFTKQGAGTLRLTGVNTYTGDTTVNGGTLQIGNNNGGKLGGSGGNYAGNISITSGTLSIASNVDQTLSGIISGAGSLIKENSGTLFLGNSNTYTGKTTITPTTSTDATISIASFNSVNGGTPLLTSSSLGAPTTVANGTIDLGNSAAGRRAAIIYTGAGETTDRVINFRFNNNGSVHTISNTGAGLLKFTSAATGAGDTTQNRGAVTLAGDGNGEFSQGLPFNFSNLTKSGNGTWTLGGAVGSGFSSAAVLTVNAGTLALQKKTSLHNGDTTRWTAAKINVKSGATLALNVDSGDVDGLSAASLDTLLTNIYGGTSTSQGLQAGATLGLDTSTATGGSFTQGNAITNSTGTGGGALGLTKLGTGMLVLDKANTYTGATNINKGTLLVNNTTGSGTGTGAVTVASGATLGGTGTMSGTLAVTGSIAPGAAGVVDIKDLKAGTTTWHANGNDWAFDLGANTGDADKLVITGDFLKSGTGTFRFDFMSSPVSYGKVYDLVSWTGNTTFAYTNFTYTGLTGAYATQGQFSITGNTLNFTAVPEPSTALGGLLLTAGLLRRRRKSE